MKILGIILIICGIIGGIGLVADGDVLGGILGGLTFALFGAVLLRRSKLKNKNTSMSNGVSESSSCGNDVSIKTFNLEKSVQKSPVLQYPHESNKIAPPKNFTDENGVRWLARYQYDSIALERINVGFDEFFEYDYLDVRVQGDKDVIFSFFGNDIGVLGADGLKTMISDFIGRGEPTKAQVQEVQGDVVLIRLYFYKKRWEVLEPQNPIRFKLAGNSGEEMQNNISCCTIGDEIYAEEDLNWEKERFLVWCGAIEIGYTPPSKYDILQRFDNEGYELNGNIIDITCDDDKYSVWVEIIPQ